MKALSTQADPRFTKVIFHGRLKKYAPVTAQASTPAKLIRAAMFLRPGLRSEFDQGSYSCFRGMVCDDNALDPIGLHLMMPQGGVLHVIPAGEGSGGGRGASIGKVIVGAVIAVAAVVAAIPSGGTSLAAGFAAEASIGGVGLIVSYGAIALFGATLFLSGVSTLISKATATGTNSAASTASTTLSGIQNTTQQGGCVPLIYGKRVRVGSTVVSVGYSAEDFNASITADDGVTTANPASGTGSGGGSKGSSSSGATMAADTLRSKAVVRILDVIGEGPGVNLCNGAQSIFFNGTPLMASDGTLNFQGVSWVWRSGEPDQTSVPGYPASESTIAVSTQVKANTPVTQSITSSTATAARVTIRIPALYTTDQKTGAVSAGPDVGVLIEVRPTGGTYATVVSDLLHGQKSTSEYQKSYRFNLPGANTSSDPGSWDIRMTRTTPDATVVTTQSDTYFDYLDTITDHRLTYSNSAYCALTFDSSAFGSSMPTREYEVTGKSIRVPANYDTVGRTYATSGTGTSAGAWDGVTWKLGYAVDDPCWAFLDMVQASRYGYGLPDSVTEALIYEMYEQSQYASGLVDDGLFGTEFRYMLNVAMTSAGDAYNVLQQFTSSFRAMNFWTAGGVSSSIDMPVAPTMLVTNANVLDGKFTYEGTSGSTRHNICRVSYLNANNNFAQDIEVYVDQASVSAVGPRSVDLEAFGCTSRGLARRLGRWMIDTELHQTQTVTYNTGIDHAGVRPGDVIMLADRYYQGVRHGGRLRSGSTTTVIPFDAVFTPEAGQTYTLYVTLDDGTLADATVNSWTTATDVDGTYTVAHCASGIGAAPTANAPYLLMAVPTYNIPQFRVVSNLEKSHGQYSITALFHDPAKFDRVEKRLPFNEVSYSNLPSLISAPVTPPSAVQAQDYTVGVGTTTVIRVTVGWTPPVDAKITGYQIRSVNNTTGETIYYIGNGLSASYDIDNLPVGNYTFGVQSTGRNGIASVWVDAPADAVDGSPDAPDAPTGLTANGGTRRISLSWIAPFLRNLLHYEVWRAPAQSNGSAGIFTLLTYVDATSYTDTDEDNLEPLTTWFYEVRAVSTMGALGAFAGPVSAETTELLVDDLPAAIQATAKYAQGLLNSLGTPIDVATLSAAGTQPEGQIIFNEADGKLYIEKNGTPQPYIPVIPASNGQLTSDQIASIAATKIQGSLTSDQITSLAATKVSGTLTAAQIATITAAQITGQVVASQIASVTASVISGQLTNTQIASLAASKISGTLTASQIASIAASQVTGTLVASQIGAVTASVITGQLTASQIASLAATQITGTLTDAQLAAIAATKITGTLVSTQIASVAATVITGTLTSAQIASLASTKISGTLTASQIASIASTQITGQLTSAQIASVASSIISGQLTDSQIVGLSAAKLTSQITTTQITDGAISTAKIAAGAIVANSIAASAVTAAALAIGSGANVLPNSTFTYDASGWTIGASTGLTLPKFNSTFVDDATHRTAIGNGYVNATWSAASGGYIDVACGTNMDCQPGDNVEFQVRLLPGLSCYGFAWISWLDAGGNQLSSVNGPNIIGVDTNSRLPTVIGSYYISGLTAKAPANAAGVKLVVRMVQAASYAAGTFAVMWFTQALLGHTNSGATQLSTWAPGGLTSISGGQITAATITALQIAAGTIVAGNIAAGTITSSQIATDTIVAANIAAGAITASELSVGAVTAGAIAAGAVTASALSIGTASNFLANSCFLNTIAGWGYATLGTNTGVSFVPGAAITGLPEGYGVVSAATMSSGALLDIAGPYMAVTPGQTIEAQAQIFFNSSAGLLALIYLVFETAAGATISTPNGNSFPASATAVGSGAVLANFLQSGIIAAAPANTARVKMVIRFTSSAAITGLYGYITHCALGITTVNATSVSPWTPGGVTQINGAQITTASISALQIAASTITAGQIAAGTITSSQIAADTIVAGNIAAGAITASELSANSVTAYALAAGSVTTAALAVGSSANVLPNSTFTYDASGWGLAGTASITAPAFNSTFIGDATHRTGIGNAYVNGTWSAASGGYQDVLCNTIMDCQPGDMVEFQVRLLPGLSSYGYAYVAFLDAGGNLLGSAINGPNIVGADTNTHLATVIASYFVSGGVAKAPANAASVKLLVRMVQASGYASGTYGVMWFTQALLGHTVAGATQLSAWAPGGLTAISGGQITAATITTLQIAANTIVAGDIAAGTITSAQIATDTIVAGNIAAGAITTSELSVGAVTAQNIAAGAVTTAALSVGSSANVLPNSTFTYDTSAWGLGAVVSLTTGTLGSTWNGFTPQRTANGNGYINGTWSAASAGYLEAFCSTTIDCRPGDTIEFQGALLAGLSSYGYVWLAWLDAGGNQIGTVLGPNILGVDTTVHIPSVIGSYFVSGGIAKAPANTAGARVGVRMAQSSGYASGAFAVLYFTQFLLGHTTPNATQLSAWAPGGLTSISGGQINAASITALQIAASTIVAGNIAAGTITAANIAADTITAAQIAANAITSTELSAGAVTAGKLAAGSVLAGNLTVGSSTNVIWNPCFDYFGSNVDGWQLGFPATGTGSPQFNGVASGVWLDDSQKLAGYGAGAMLFSGSYGLPAAGVISLSWAPSAALGAYGIAINGGDAYGASCLAACDGLPIYLQVVFFDANKNLVGSATSASTTNALGGGTGYTDASYTRLAVCGVSPSTAAYATFRFIYSNTSTSTHFNGEFVLTKCMFGQVPINAIDPGPWTPGGITTISGNSLKTGSMSATKIIANSITAGQIQAGAITTAALAAGAVTAYSVAANSITAGAIAANAVTAGTIQAGAVASDQIAANQIFGKHMAADTILTLQAQIGNLIVNTIHIVGDAITSYFSVTFSAKIVATGLANYLDIGSFTITVPNARQGFLLISADHSYSGQLIAHQFMLYTGGALIRQKGGLNEIDYPTFSTSITLAAGSTLFDLKWSGANGNVSIQNVDILFLGRVK